MLAAFIFWISIAAILYTYLIYPFILQILSAGRKENELYYGLEEELPRVTVLMSVYNEESVLKEKIRSLFNTSYPLAKLELVVGSDGSTDNSNQIIRSFIDEGYPIVFRSFKGRNGKSAILNELFKLARGEILVLTDANILFDKNLIFELVKHFKNPSIGLVGANVLNKGLKKDGISLQESAYIKRENIIKYREGILWGTMMGAFGACYAIRSSLYCNIPPNFLMEDYFISMKVLTAGFAAMNNLKAKCYEDVSNKISVEFRRKMRISAGNFQNLVYFSRILWHPFSKLAFTFYSHKVIRWLGPFFLIAAIISSAFLLPNSRFYQLALILQLFALLTPLLDYLLRKLHIHFLLLRFINYFYMMNFALLIGFFRFLTGIKSSAWNSTERNQ